MPGRLTELTATTQQLGSFCKKRILCVSNLPSSFALAWGSVAEPNAWASMLVGSNENNAGFLERSRLGQARSANSRFTP
jgi:hypothetical protein